MQDREQASSEEKIVQDVFNHLKPDANGTIPSSQIDDLVASAQQNRGFYGRKNPETGRSEQGNAIGWVLQSTVMEYLRPLLQIDSSKNE
ncbi:MAG: hypothetical protein G01um101425_913 [Candidatus Peregrinibacteria bacterium Gr01-1014_25]|nr:MAG: hypothetical protein G01um101425_913 [Candidatus Peregrinibacteria bacterium Gr01-1014_25]